MNLFTKPKLEKINTRKAVSQAFGTPLMKIGKGDLTKPFINSYNYANSIFVRFGEDNLFPQLIDQMYYQSPLHSSIIDFQVNAAIGGGFEIELPIEKSPEQIVNELTFLKTIRANKLIKGIARDIKMHKRVHFKVTKKGDTILKLERIMPSKVRYNSDFSKFWISDNWSSSPVGTPLDAYVQGTAKEKVTQMLSYIDLDSCPGQDVYPLDKTVSAFNWCYLDGQSANLQKENIQRSIFGNLVIARPTEFKTPEEIRTFREGIETKEGEIVPVLVLSANGKDNLPEVSAFPANQNDKAFENMDKRIDDKICQAHTINPAVMGIERPGALGNGTDIKEAYPIWEKNVVEPFRASIEEVFDEIMEIYNVQGNFKINDFSLLEMLVSSNNDKTV